MVEKFLFKSTKFALIYHNGKLCDVTDHFDEISYLFSGMRQLCCIYSTIIKERSTTFLRLFHNKNNKPFRKVSTFAKGSNLERIITHHQRKSNSFVEISKNSAKIYEQNARK